MRVLGVALHTFFGRVPGPLGPDSRFPTIDGGNTAVWCAHYYRNARPDAIHSTFKFGMLGAGVGQALGLKAAHPQRPVACIIGDGAMGMHPQEIETAVRAYSVLRPTCRTPGEAARVAGSGTYPNPGHSC